MAKQSKGGPRPVHHAPGREQDRRPPLLCKRGVESFRIRSPFTEFVYKLHYSIPIGKHLMGSSTEPLLIFPFCLDH